MSVRDRLRDGFFTGWRQELFGSHKWNSRTVYTLYEHCVDVVAAGDNWPLSVRRVSQSGGLINGSTNTAPFSGYTWYDYPCAYRSDSWMQATLPITDQPSYDYLATEMAARTEPYRSSFVSLEYTEDIKEYGILARDKFAEFLFKLSKRFPKKVFSALSRAAQLNLLIQFQILPLMSDIGILMQFQERVDTRVKEVKRLYGKRGLRRTKHLYSGSSTMATVIHQLIQSQGIALSCDLHKQQFREISGHIRWYAIFPIEPADAQLRSQVKAAIAGYELNPYTIYQLIPWSWFIDYFTNLGSLIQAASNQFEIYHEPITLTVVDRIKFHSDNHSSYSNGGHVVTCTPLYSDVVTIERFYANPSLVARQGMLSAAQTSILGSLAILRS